MVNNFCVIPARRAAAPNDKEPCAERSGQRSGVTDGASASGRSLAVVPASPERPWYGVREAAEMLGVSRQAVNQRVRGLQGAQLVDGHWRIPAEVVQALLTAERAKAKAVGTVVSLPGVPENGPIDQAETGDLTRRVAELERAVTEQDREFRRQLADRDAIIDELRSERRHLRQALASLMQGLGHLIGDGD